MIIPGVCYQHTPSFNLLPDSCLFSDICIDIIFISHWIRGNDKVENQCHYVTLGAQYIFTSIVACCLKSLLATTKQRADVSSRNTCLSQTSYLWNLSYPCAELTAISTMASAISVIIKTNDDKHLVKRKGWSIWNGKSSDFILILAAQDWERLGKKIPNNGKWGN